MSKESFTNISLAIEGPETDIGALLIDFMEEIIDR